MIFERKFVASYVFEQLAIQDTRKMESRSVDRCQRIQERETRLQQMSLSQQSRLANEKRRATEEALKEAKPEWRKRNIRL